MRGSPILRALLAFIALAALAPLLWKLTQPALGQTAPKALHAKPATAAGRLSFSSPATRVAIQHLGREIWSKASPGAEEEVKLEIPWPKEGVELRLIAAWPEGIRTAAMRLRLTAPDGTEHDRTVWGEPDADEILLFP